MKIIARQVDPEYQESPLFIEGCFPENIAVCGNRDYIDRKPDVFERVQNTLDEGDLAEAIWDINQGSEEDNYYYWEIYDGSIKAAINDFLPPEGKEYSDKDISALEEWVAEYGASRSYTNDEILCKVLSIVTGKEWKCREIHGSCQGDWNTIYYPADEWTKEALENFEIEYFNMGNEFGISILTEEDCNGDIGDVDLDDLDIDYYMYCHSCGDKEIKREIAESCGEDVSPEDVELYAFDGYIKKAKYRKVG